LSSTALGPRARVQKAHVIRRCHRALSKLLGRAALVGILAVTSGCAPVFSAPPPRYVVLNRLADVMLVDFGVVSFVDVDLHTALQTREAVETEFHSAYGRPGHLRWFFHAFDGETLDFVVARYDAEELRYVAQRRLRVRRSREAERTLGVVGVVREYEIGMGGVRAGMSSRQVVAVAGPAEARVTRARGGSFDLLYPTFCVRIAEDRVEHVWRRDLCS
jgi:hypothetical protein